ncbi:MAG: hypothetical protein COW54_06835 [Rhodobacteraceae bacterium CG17_big_fil_post_rev_8_21_14_2_50_63_15]|nr:hypothetical protein [Roseovarius sp.]PIV78941.1 MAG: hypothetical protein COW54_06835 [Rhodobacteraceae bacterium CG17_big_fil_post_rev_8_21_14_2_50_63_15]
MIREIWNSFRRLPLWVQVWVVVILVPVNAAALLWWTAPMGAWVAMMAVGAMLLNAVIMLIERGFSKFMALPHVLIWIPLLGLVLWLLTQEIAPGYRRYLIVLLIVDAFSLALDCADLRKWWTGERSVA